MKNQLHQERATVTSLEPPTLSATNTLSDDTRRQLSSTEHNNSEIEHTITQLLKSTRCILYALTAWSNGDMSADQVMESYHSLEEYFGRASLAFKTVNLTLDEVAYVPGHLHKCLEDALSSPPSTAALEQHLPAIRETILQLLHSLKQKQSQLRQLTPVISASRRGAPNEAATGFSPRPPSTGPTCSNVSPIQRHTSTTRLSGLDMNDPGTSETLVTLKQQDNLTNHTTVRRAYTSYRADGHPIAPPRRHPVIREKGTGALDNTVRQPQNDTEDAMVLFLQVREKVKRIQLQGLGPVTIPGLRLLFLQKFEHVPDTPIQIRDPKTHIIYELEDVHDVVPNCLLILPENDNDNGGQRYYQMILDKLEMIHQEMTQTETHTKTMPVSTGTAEQQQSSVTSDSLYKALQEKQHEVARLSQDLAILRQIASEFQLETKEILSELHVKTIEYREHQRFMLMAEPGGAKNRQYVQETKKRSEAAAKAITRQLQDLQDVVDQLKLDITQRRCRPSTEQLDRCYNQVRTLEKEIDELDQLIRTGMPIWKVTWESELQNVVNEQRFLKDQESLLLDLRDDHADLLDVLQQLKKISEIQSRNGRQSKKVIPVPEMMFHNHGDSNNSGMASVLKQVSTIEVDHSKRVEALEKAEKTRTRELASRIDHFEKELSTFVDEKKLKRTGGPELVDRQRRKKDEEILKELCGASTNKK